MKLYDGQYIFVVPFGVGQWQVAHVGPTGVWDGSTICDSKANALRVARRQRRWARRREAKKRQRKGAA